MAPVEIWKSIEGNRMRWLAQTVGGLVWATYAYWGYPLGAPTSFVAGTFWALTGVAIVRVLAVTLLLVMRNERSQ